jgi:hypothetical protein
MKRLLRDKPLGLYYKGGGEWTSNKSKAVEFKNTQCAIDCGVRLKRREIQLIMSFKGCGKDIAFPFRTLLGEPARA